MKSEDFETYFLASQIFINGSNGKIEMTICGLSFDPNRRFGGIDFEASELNPGII